MDRTDFNTALNQAKADAQKFASQTYTAKLAADKTAFDQALADAKAKLDEFAGKYEAKLGADATDLDAKISDARSRLDELGAMHEDPSVGLDDSRAVAVLEEISAKLDELDQSVTDVRLTLEDADIGERLDEVKEKLDEIGNEEADPKLGLDDSEFKRKLDEDKQELKDAGNDSGGFSLGSLFSGGLTSPGVLGLGAVGAGSLLPALPGALAGASAAAGTLGAAFAGVGKALSAYQTQSQAATTSTSQMASGQLSAANQIRTAQQAVSAAETQQAHDAITSAEAVKTAQQGVSQAETQAAHDAITSAESIKNAQQGVAQATQQAAQSQISAEQTLANAQYAEQQAQESLTQARQQAILTLQQLTNASEDAALSVQQDQLNVQQAQATQAQVDASSTSTSLQREQAALAVKEAEQQLKEAIENRTNSSKAAQTADKEGVAGNPAVLAAEHALAQSKQAVSNAQRALAQAEEQGAQAIAKAEQNLADAVRSASWQRIADAGNVAKAQQGLSDASRNASWQQQSDAKNVSNAQAGLKSAYASAALAGKSSSSTQQQAAAATAKAMAALTPAGKRVVTMIEGMLGAWKKLQGIAQTAVLPGVVTFLKGVQSILPEVDKEVGKMGGIFSQAFSSIGKTLQSSGFQKELADLFKEGNQFIKILGPALGTMTADFIKMGAQSGPAVTGLAKGLAGIANGIGALFKGLAPFSKAAGSILETLGKAVGAIGAPLAKVLGTLMQAIAPLLKGALPLFKSLLDQIARIVVAAGPGLTAIGKTLGQMLTALTPLVKPLGTLVVQMIKLLDDAITPLLPVLPQLIPPLVQLMSAGLQPMSELLVAVTPLVTDLATVLAALISDGLVPIVGALADAVSAVDDIEAAGISWITNLGNIQDALDSFRHWVASEWDHLLSDATTFWTQTLPNMIQGAVTSAVNWVQGHLDTFRHTVATKWDNMLSDVKTFWTQQLPNAIEGAVGKVDTWILGKLDALRHGIAAKWDAIVSYAKTKWNELEGITQKPIQWIITNVYDKLIVRFWNDIAGPVGLPKLKTLAGGGIIPGYAPGKDTVPALLSPGEGVLVPEAVRALGPETIHAINYQYGRGRGGMMGAFAGGGIAGDASPASGGGGPGGWISDIGGAVSGVWDNLGGTLKHEIGSLEHDLRAGLALPMKAIGKLIASAAGHVPGTAGIAEAARKMPVTLWDKATSWVIGHTSPGAGGTGKYTGHYGAGVAQWRPDVLKVLSMLNEPASLAGQVLYQMQTECVPVDYQILTRRGWLKHGDVRAGDETIGYNLQSGQSEWTRITAVNHYGQAEIVRYGNQYWSAECTPNHRWLTEHLVRRPVGRQPLDACPECGATGGQRGPFSSRRALQIHRANAHGVAGARAGDPTEEVVAGTSLLSLEEMNQQDRIVLARKASTSSSLDITTREASLLGWIAGDGFVQEDAGRMTFAFSIYQSKTQFFRAIDYACNADPKHSRYEPRPGRKSHWKESTQWRLSTPYSRDLRRRAGHPKRDAVALVLAMSTEQRDAWLEALLLSEGCWSGGKVVYYQNAGEIADAIELAVYLSGNRPSRGERVRQNRIAVQITETAPYVGGPSRRVQWSEAPPREVWCPTTELGSWTARSDAGIFLTGNSGGNPNAINLTDSNAAAGDPSRGLLQTIMTTFEAYRSRGLPNDIYNPEANIYAAVNYAIHTYGRSLMRDGQGLGSGHGYDSGGWLDPGMTLAVNNTGSPEAILTGDQWDSISGIAQGGGSASLEKRLDRIARILERSPAITAGGLSDALNGMGRGALQRGSHSVR